MLQRILITLSGLLIAANLIAQVSFSANYTSGCSPLGVVISVTAPAAGSISSYAWTITRPDGTQHNSSNSQYVAILSAPGTYDVSLTVNGNQTHTVNDYITVFANPTASFTVDDPVGCYPLSVNFQNTSTQGSGPITSWDWDFGNGSTANGASITYTYPQAGTFTPVLSIEDANGCFSAIAMPGLIQVLSTFPNANLSSSFWLTCNPPQAIAFTNSSTGNGSLQAVWDFGDGTTSNQTGTGVLNHTYNGTGTYDVCLTAIDPVGCTNQECHTLTIFDQAAPSFTVSDNSVCVGQPVAFTNTTVPVAPQYSWDFNGNGTPDASSANPTYVFQSAGTYQPTLLATYSPGCAGTFTGPPITVQPGLAVSFTASQTNSCQTPFPVTFQNMTPGSGLTCTWYINGQNAGTGATLNYSFNQFGIYDVTLLVTNTDGCTSQFTQNDLISVQAPAISFTNPAYICEGEEVQITDLNITSVEPITAWDWDFTGDGLTDVTGENPIWSYSSTGNYSISLTITTASGCTATYTSPLPILVLNSVNTGFTSNTTYSCAGESIEFCVTDQPGNQFSWNFGDASGWYTMANDEICITHDYQDTGFFSITLTVFNGACNSTIELEDYIYITPPVAIFDFNVECADLYSVDFADLSIEAATIVWDFGDGSPTVTDEAEPTHVFPGPGSYDVSLTAYNDIIGCPDETVVTIALFPPDPAMSFNNISQCPPAQVELFSDADSHAWNIQISNGDSVSINWDNQVSRWNVDYTHGGITEHSEFLPEQEFWPTLIFDQAGCYDVLVSTTDAFGCTAQANYPNAICINAGTDFASFDPLIVNSCDSVSISFIPDATNLVSWTWDFGDGSGSSQENPTHTFLPPFDYGQELEITLTASDNAGCTSTVSQQVPIDFPVIPAFTISNLTPCQNEEVDFDNTTTGPASSYTWDFGDPASGAQNTSNEMDAVHSFSESGAFSICLSAENSAGCVRTTCLPAALNVMTPEASFTFNSSINNCLYGVSFDNTSVGTYNSITWDFGDAQTGIGDQVYHTYPLGVYDVTLIVSNVYGCSDTTIVYDLFSYGDVIGPYSAELDAAVCAPFDVTLSAFNLSDTYFTYFWDFDDGYGDPSGSTVSSHSYQEAGVYCPSLIMTDPNGCDVLIPCTDPIIVEEFTLDYSIDSEICAGDTIHLIIDNAESYEWAPGSPVTAGSGLGDYLLHPSQTGDFLVTGYYADCVREEIIHVDVHPLPTVSLQMDPSHCHLDTSFSVFGGSPDDIPGSYSIAGNPVDNFDPAWNPGSYELRYTYTDTYGCVSFANQTIEIHPLPVVSYSSHAPMCENEAEITLSGGSPVGGYYELGNNPATTFDPSSGFGEYETRYVYTDVNGCTNSAEELLVVHAAANAHIDVFPTCQNLPLQVLNTSTIEDGAIATTQWDFGSEHQTTGFQPGEVYMSMPGNYSLELSLISNHGCISTLDTTFTIWPVPVPQFTFGIGCENQEILFNSQSTLSSGSIAEWIWNVGGLFAGDSTSVGYTYANYNDATMTLVNVSDNGCLDSLTLPVLVRPAPDVELITGPLCEGTESDFIANATIAYGGITGYSWDFGDGSPNETNAASDHLYASSGAYTLTLDVISNLGCHTILTENIDVHPKPVVEFALDAEEACASGPVGLLSTSYSSSPSQIISWNWYFDDALVSQSESEIIQYSTPGLYDVRLAVTTNYGCQSDSTSLASLQLFPLPEADFEIAREELSMSIPTVEIRNESSEDVTEWWYDFGDGSTASFSEGLHEYSTWDSFLITQIVSNTFGCSDTAQRQVHIKPELIVYVPNAFTPDGNGHNEGFKPVLYGFDPVYYEFQVFDRWGTLVFDTRETTACWNGQYENEGEMSPDGVYNWQLDIRSKESPVLQRKMGSVTLLK